MRINDELTGWTEQEFTSYGQDGLTGLINGGADQYNNAGVVSGIQQRMTEEAAQTKYFEAMVMNFFLDTLAENMFEIKKQEISEVLAIGEYPNTTAIGSRFLGGV